MERVGSRGLQRHRALDARGAAEIVASGDDQRRPCRSAYAQREADFSFPSRDALHLPRHFGVLGLPDDVAGLHQSQIERTLVGAAEEHPQQSRRHHVARMQSAARLVVLRLSLVEKDAIAGLQLRCVRFRTHDHATRPGVDLLDAPDEHAAVPGIEAVHQRLVVGAAEKAVREAAREAVAKLLLVPLLQRIWAVLEGGIEGAAVLVHRVRDVLRPLHPAFDLEAADSGVDQLGK